MGYYAIRVDTDELENSARKAEEFVRVYDNKMKNISGGISGASAYWQGEEYTLFSNKWHEMEAGGSVSEKTKQAMKNYAAYLCMRRTLISGPRKMPRDGREGCRKGKKEREHGAIFRSDCKSAWGMEDCKIPRFRAVWKSI